MRLILKMSKLHERKEWEEGLRRKKIWMECSQAVTHTHTLKIDTAVPPLGRVSFLGVMCDPYFTFIRDDSVYGLIQCE